MNHDSFFKVSQRFTSSNADCPILGHSLVPDDGELEIVESEGGTFVQPRDPTAIKEYQFSFVASAEGGETY